MQTSKEKYFTKQLLNWNKKFNDRNMPWKGIKDPYKIWLSEVILQQTKVEQGIHYYIKFTEKYTNIISLANAKDKEVYKLWEGLGYYNRCKNLLFTARKLRDENASKFPTNYHEILQLKGIGVYTAAAIASFAFNLPYAVIDGNVYRILARYFGIHTPIDSNEGKKEFTHLANKLLDKRKPAVYNQAIMDFGATVCKPNLPLCNNCKLKKNCIAFISNEANLLPIKNKRIVKKHRWLNYFILINNHDVWIKERTEKDIWQNLHEFYLVESEKKIKWNELNINKQLQQLNIKNYTIKNISKEFKQQLTHQSLHVQFIQILISTKPTTLKRDYWISQNKLSTVAFPKIINEFIKNKDNYLTSS